MTAYWPKQPFPVLKVVVADMPDYHWVEAVLTGFMTILTDFETFPWQNRPFLYPNLLYFGLVGTGFTKNGHFGHFGSFVNSVVSDADLTPGVTRFCRF